MHSSNIANGNSSLGKLNKAHWFGRKAINPSTRAVYGLTRKAGCAGRVCREGKVKGLRAGTRPERESEALTN